FGSFPLGMEMMPGLTYTRATFFIRLLPYVEQDNLYKQWNFDSPAANVSTNQTASRAATLIPTFVCPSDGFRENPYQLAGPPAAFPGQGESGAVAGWYSGTSYAGNYGEGSDYTRFSQVPLRPQRVLLLAGHHPALR